jgi:hypothetical protein
MVSDKGRQVGAGKAFFLHNGVNEVSSVSPCLPAFSLSSLPPMYDPSEMFPSQGL